MYKIKILDKYNFIYIDYINNINSTKLSVSIEDRLTNTILTFMDYKGFLHIELFVGTEDETTDEEWVNDGNWIDAVLIYHKCFNESWNTDFSTTALQVPCQLRYRGNILHIYNVPAYDTCGEVYYEDKTYRYKCICCDDCKYGNIDNWEEYNFQLIIDDIVKIVTDLMQEANDINYGLLTPDEEMITNLIEDLFIKWLTDEKLQEAVNEWLNNEDVDSVIKEWLQDYDFNELFGDVVNEWLADQNLQSLINSWMEGQDLQQLVNFYLEQQDFDNYITSAIQDIINNIDFDSLVKKFVDEAMESINLDTYIEEWLQNQDNEQILKEEINKFLDQYDFTDDVNNAITNWLLNNQDDLKALISDILQGLNFEQMIKDEVERQLAAYDFESEIKELVDQYFQEHNIGDIVNEAVENYFNGNIDNILNNYFQGVGNDNLTQIINDLLDDKISDYLQAIQTLLENNERVIANALSRHEEDILNLKS